MATNLIEMAKQTQNPLGKAIILDLLRQCPMLQMIPIESIGGLKKTTTRWQTLPTASTRAIGAGYTEGTGTTEQVVDSLGVYGGDISVDQVLTKVTDAIENPLETQSKMKVAAIAALINDHFINGDHSLGGSYLNGFEGLKKRISNQPARASISLESSGDSLKVLASAANEQTFLDALHAALHRVGAVATAGPTSANVVMFMNEATLLGVGQVLRRLGLLKTTEDAYGRVFDTFGPAKLMDIGLLADQTTEVITSTEATGDGGTDGSSIYTVRFGGLVHKDASGKVSVMDDDGIKLLQLNGTSLEPYDLPHPGAGSAPLLSKQIDWVIGLGQNGRYSASRIYGFKMAAS